MAFNLSNIFRRDNLRAAFNRIGTPKTYEVSISQSGTAAPVVDSELVNSVGSITFSRDAAGEYFALSSGLFLNNKTVVRFSISIGFVNDETYSFYRIDDDSNIYFKVLASDDTETDGWKGTLTIEVYD